MSDNSKIEWCEATWNPVTGCTKVSPGCDHCYAERIVERFKGKGAFENVTLNPERLDVPLRWRKPRRVFVNSMSDLFHDSVPDEYIARVFAVMAATPRHSYQVLTKRHARMRAVLGKPGFERLVTNRMFALNPYAAPLTWPLPNTWLGVSVEDQKWADIRVPALLDTPAAVRFLSCEPLLGPVDLAPRLRPSWGEPYPEPTSPKGIPVRDLVPPVAWVIVGGESGPGARPMHPDWARSLRDQCTAAGVPYFFKQWGEWKPAPSNYGPDVPARARAATQLLFADGQDVDGRIMLRAGKHAAGRELDGRTWDEYPEAARA